MAKAAPALGGLALGLLVGALAGIQIERAWPGSGETPTPDPAPGAATATTAPTPPVTATTAASPVDPAPGTSPTPSTPARGPQAPEHPEAPTPAPPEGDHLQNARVIRGRVVAEDAIPVPGAWVTAGVDYRPAAEAICDKDGVFVIAVPGDLPITLRARARRSSESQSYETAAEPGQNVVVVLTVRDRGTLQGRAIGSTGEPVADATVVLRWEEPEHGTPPVDDDGNPDLMPQRTAVTDAAGAFAFAGCWAGSAGGVFVVEASHPKHYPQTVRLHVPDPFRLPEPFGVQVTLLDAAGGTAHGRLVAADGRPIVSAYVMGLVRDGREITEWKRFEVTNGEFEIKFGRAGATVVLTPMVNGGAGIPLVIDALDERDDAPPVELRFVPAPPLLTGKLLPPPGGGLAETRFAMEITSGKIAAPVTNPPVKFDPVSGDFAFPRQFYGIEGGAAYGTLTIVAPGCKPKIVDFNAFDGETEDLGTIQLEGE